MVILPEDAQQDLLDQDTQMYAILIFLCGDSFGAVNYKREGVQSYD